MQEKDPQAAQRQAGPENIREQIGLPEMRGSMKSPIRLITSATRPTNKAFRCTRSI